MKTSKKASKQTAKQAVKSTPVKSTLPPAVRTAIMQVAAYKAHCHPNFQTAKNKKREAIRDSAERRAIVAQYRASVPAFKKQIPKFADRVTLDTSIR